MIIFHEGLPGSGKSYEAFVKHVFKAIKSGRKVFAYIEGINHKKVAEILGFPVAIVEAFLIQIKEDQVKTIYEHVEDNSLVIIDEIQDFFSADNKPLEKNITTFVTQHRHRGIDIIIMG